MTPNPLYDPPPGISRHELTLIGQGLNRRLHEEVRDYVDMKARLPDDFTPEMCENFHANMMASLKAIEQVRNRFVPCPIFGVDKLIEIEERLKPSPTSDANA